ncbi:hypothetical protein B0H14DRAFT_2585700 [Mycena olivaceomarginata]|nr:hypothetical protein B0H14DRAFT_2585700 [Mycena olivaceomarginata]
MDGVKSLSKECTRKKQALLVGMSKSAVEGYPELDGTHGDVDKEADPSSRPRTPNSRAPSRDRVSSLTSARARTHDVAFRHGARGTEARCRADNPERRNRQAARWHAQSAASVLAAVPAAYAACCACGAGDWLEFGSSGAWEWRECDWLHNRLWLNMAINRGVHCDSDASLLNQPATQALSSSREVTVDVGWFFERMLEILSAPDVVGCHRDSRAFERLNQIEAAPVRASRDQGGGAVQQCKGSSVVLPAAACRAVRPFQKTIPLQVGKNQQYRTLPTHIHQERVQEQTKNDKQGDLLNKAMRSKQPATPLPWTLHSCAAFSETVVHLVFHYVTVMTPSVTIMSPPPPPSSNSSVTSLVHAPDAPQQQDVDPQILEALSSKHRIYVLKLGELMEALINDRSQTRQRIDLSPATTYQRMLVHRCSPTIVSDWRRWRRFRRRDIQDRKPRQTQLSQHQQTPPHHRGADSRVQRGPIDFEKDQKDIISSASPSASLVSSSSTGTSDDPGSPATESEWSGSSAAKKQPLRRANSSNVNPRSLRGSAPAFMPSSNTSFSSRISRAPSPVFQYPALYEPPPPPTPTLNFAGVAPQQQQMPMYPYPHLAAQNPQQQQQQPPYFAPYQQQPYHAGPYSHPPTPSADPEVYAAANVNVYQPYAAWPVPAFIANETVHAPAVKRTAEELNFACAAGDRGGDEGPHPVYEQMVRAVQEFFPESDILDDEAVVVPAHSRASSASGHTSLQCLPCDLPPPPPRCGPCLPYAVHWVDVRPGAADDVTLAALPDCAAIIEDTSCPCISSGSNTLRTASSPRNTTCHPVQDAYVRPTRRLHFSRPWRTLPPPFTACSTRMAPPSPSRVLSSAGPPRPAQHGPQRPLAPKCHPIHPVLPMRHPLLSAACGLAIAGHAMPVTVAPALALVGVDHGLLSASPLHSVTPCIPTLSAPRAALRVGAAPCVERLWHRDGLAGARGGKRVGVRRRVGRDIVSSSAFTGLARETAHGPVGATVRGDRVGACAVRGGLVRKADASVNVQPKSICFFASIGMCFFASIAWASTSLALGVDCLCFIQNGDSVQIVRRVSPRAARCGAEVARPSATSLYTIPIQLTAPYMLCIWARAKALAGSADRVKTWCVTVRRRKSRMKRGREKDGPDRSRTNLRKVKENSSEY